MESQLAKLAPENELGRRRRRKAFKPWESGPAQRVKILNHTGLSCCCYHSVLCHSWVGVVLKRAQDGVRLPIRDKQSSSYHSVAPIGGEFQALPVHSTNTVALA